MMVLLVYFNNIIDPCNVLLLDPCLYEMKDKSLIKLYGEYEKRPPESV